MSACIVVAGILNCIVSAFKPLPPAEAAAVLAPHQTVFVDAVVRDSGLRGRYVTVRGTGALWLKLGTRRRVKRGRTSRSSKILTKSYGATINPRKSSTGKSPVPV